MELPSFPHPFSEKSSSRRSVPRQFRYFLRSLPPSDKAIAAFLIFCVLITCVATLLTLIRSFQVVVPAHGGSLHEGVVGSPRFANPLLANSDSDRDLVELTYAGLMGHDASGNLIPILAESYTVSSDGRIYTFTLRGSATFSDGSPVTADDVTYTIQKAQDPGLKSVVYANWSNIKVQAVDARTVRFTLPQPYALFLDDATIGILPKHIWQTVSDEEFPFSPYASQPVGAGPFTVKSITRNSAGVITDYTLSAFKHYVTGKAYISSIHFTYFNSEADLAQALQQGGVTSAYGVATQNTMSAPYTRVFGVFFNPAQEPAFKDSNVRKALSFAINRTTISQTTLAGYANPIDGPLPFSTASSSLLQADQATRIAEAKSALNDAGYTYASSTNTWTKEGKSLQITLTTSNVPELKAVAVEIQKAWQSLGVQTEIHYSDPSQLTQTVIRPRAYSALLFGEVVGADPDLYAFWDSAERTDPGLNIADYSNKDVDTLLEKARATADPIERKDILEQAAQKIAADYPAAFLYAPDFLYTVPTTIHNVSLESVSAPSDRFFAVSRWYRYTEHVWPIFVHHS